ncbi:MAG: hypothetical protein AB2690_15295 [Candidatus Thiodiazotropha endolucinida]
MTLMILSKDIDRYIEVVSNCQTYTSVGKWSLLLRRSSLFAIAVFRYGYWVQQKFPDKKHRLIRVMLNILYHIGRKVCMIWGKYEILETTPVGPGLVISDKGRIVVGANKIGSNVTIFSNVTIGMDMDGKKSEIGDNVVICSNSIVYGPIKVGNGCVVEPESVLTKTIPDGLSVKGNPARVSGRNVDVQSFIENELSA